MRKNEYYKSPEPLHILKYPFRYGGDPESVIHSERLLKYIDKDEVRPVSAEEALLLEHTFPRHDPRELPWHIVRESWLDEGYSEEELHDAPADDVIQSITEFAKPSRHAGYIYRSDRIVDDNPLIAFANESRRRVALLGNAIRRDKSFPDSDALESKHCWTFGEGCEPISWRNYKMIC